MRRTGRSTATFARGGRISEPPMQSKRLVSGGYRNAEKPPGDNYAAAFRHANKRFDFDRGDERQAIGGGHSSR